MKAAELAKSLKQIGIDVRRAQKTKSPVSGAPCIRVAVPGNTGHINNEFHREWAHGSFGRFSWVYVAA